MLASSNDTVVHLSSGAYNFLRDSGVISLPSQRTLRDYTYYIPMTTGFANEVDGELMEAAHVEACGEWQRCVVLILDEMHIKQDLV